MVFLVEKESLLRIVKLYMSFKEFIYMGIKRRCRVYMNRKERKEIVYGCKVCNVYLCKDGCYFVYYFV